MTVTASFNNDINKVIKRYQSMKIDNPKMYHKVMHEFRDMATGGPGAQITVQSRWSSIRKHYYTNWTDDMFQKVLKELGETS